MLGEYKVRFRVGNMMSEQIVKANTGIDAENLIKAQYGKDVIIIWVRKI